MNHLEHGLAAAAIIGVGIGIGLWLGMLARETKHASDPLPFSAPPTLGTAGTPDAQVFCVGDCLPKTKVATASQALRPGEQIQTCNGGYCTCEGDCAAFNAHRDEASGNKLSPLNNFAPDPAYWAAHGLITGTVSSSVSNVYITAKCADGWTLVSTGFRLMCAEKLTEPETAK